MAESNWFFSPAILRRADSRIRVSYTSGGSVTVIRRNAPLVVCGGFGFTDGLPVQVCDAAARVSCLFLSRDQAERRGRGTPPLLNWRLFGGPHLGGGFWRKLLL